METGAKLHISLFFSKKIYSGVSGFKRCAEILLRFFRYIFQPVDGWPACISQEVVVLELQFSFHRCRNRRRRLAALPSYSTIFSIQSPVITEVDGQKLVSFCDAEERTGFFGGAKSSTECVFLSDCDFCLLRENDMKVERSAQQSLLVKFFNDFYVMYPIIFNRQNR